MTQRKLRELGLQALAYRMCTAGEEYRKLLSQSLSTRLFGIGRIVGLLLTKASYCTLFHSFFLTQRLQRLDTPCIHFLLDCESFAGRVVMESPFSYFCPFVGNERQVLYIPTAIPFLFLYCYRRPFELKSKQMSCANFILLLNPYHFQTILTFAF